MKILVIVEAVTGVLILSLILATAGVLAETFVQAGKNMRNYGRWNDNDDRA